MGWLIIAVLPWLWWVVLPVAAPARLTGARTLHPGSSPEGIPPKKRPVVPVETALINLSARLQAGQSVPAAIEQSLRPIHAPWVGYVRAKISGSPLPIPFPAKVAGTDAQAVRTVTAASQLVKQYGMELSTILHASVQGIVAAHEADQQRSSALAGPRATARLLQWLPIAAVVAGMVMGANPLAVLFSGGWGSLLLIAGVGFLVAGRIWLSRLIALAERGELAAGRRQSENQ